MRSLNSSKLIGVAGLAVVVLAGCPTEPLNSGGPGGVLAQNDETGEQKRFPDEASVAEAPDNWMICENDICPAPRACEKLDEAPCLVRKDCFPHYAGGDPGTSGSGEGGEAGTSAVASAEQPGPEVIVAPCPCLVVTPSGEVVVMDGSDPGKPDDMTNDYPVWCDTANLDMCGMAVPPFAGCSSITPDDGVCPTRACEFQCPPGTSNPTGPNGCLDTCDCVPDDGCSPDECKDPAPGAPNFMCSDGTVGGPACRRDPSSGKCGWHFTGCTDPDPGCADVPQCDLECPPNLRHPVDGNGCVNTCKCEEVDTCAANSCGMLPAVSPRCTNGANAVANCQRVASGQCGWAFFCPAG